MGEINTHPTVCNICGGKVVYCSNERIYGRKYGSGFCYLCTNCGAYVGTHRPSPHTALGLLADAPMREGKKLCHDLFDKLWKGPKNQGARRTLMYAHLANLMEVSTEDCHFGYFDIGQLRQAYRILLRIEKMTDLLENHIPYEQICEKGQFATVKIGKKLTLRVICTKPKRKYEFVLYDEKTERCKPISTYAVWNAEKKRVCMGERDTAIKIVEGIKRFSTGISE